MKEHVSYEKNTILFEYEDGKIDSIWVFLRDSDKSYSTFSDHRYIDSVGVFNTSITLFLNSNKEALHIELFKEKNSELRIEVVCKEDSTDLFNLKRLIFYKNDENVSYHFANGKAFLDETNKDIHKMLTDVDLSQNIIFNKFEELLKQNKISNTLYTDLIVFFQQMNIKEDFSVETHKHENLKFLNDNAQKLLDQFTLKTVKLTPKLK